VNPSQVFEAEQLGCVFSKLSEEWRLNHILLLQVAGSPGWISSELVGGVAEMGVCHSKPSNHIAAFIAHISSMSPDVLPLNQWVIELI